MIYNKVFGKIGELVQGKLAEDAPFLLTNHTSSRFNTITVIEKHYYPRLRLKEKSLAALTVFLLALENVPMEEITPLSYEERLAMLKLKPEEHFKGMRISQTSNIPKGKGLSSSSTDILGLLDLLNTYFNTSYTLEQLYRMAAMVEPTDPCFSGTGMLFDQRRGRVIEQLDLPEFSLLFFDSDKKKSIDTLGYYERESYGEDNYSFFKTLLDDLREVISANRYQDFLSLITLSAEANQARLPKQGFDLLKDFAEQHQCGVFVAHTGTVMGLVAAPEQFDSIGGEAVSFIKTQWNAEVYTEKGAAVCRS